MPTKYNKMPNGKFLVCTSSLKVVAPIIFQARAHAKVAVCHVLTIFFGLLFHCYASPHGHGHGFLILDMV